MSSTEFTMPMFGVWLRPTSSASTSIWMIVSSSSSPHIVTGCEKRVPTAKTTSASRHSSRPTSMFWARYWRARSTWRLGAQLRRWLGSRCTHRYGLVEFFQNTFSIAAGLLLAT